MATLYVFELPPDIDRVNVTKPYLVPYKTGTFPPFRHSSLDPGLDRRINNTVFHRFVYFIRILILQVFFPRRRNYY